MEVDRGVDNLPVTRVYPDVRYIFAMLLEEDQISGLLPALRDPGTHTVLLFVPVWQRDTELLVDYHRKSGAVYPVTRLAPDAILGPDPLPGLPDYVLALLVGRRRSLGGWLGIVALRGLRRGGDGRVLYHLHGIGGHVVSATRLPGELDGVAVAGFHLIHPDTHPPATVL